MNRWGERVWEPNGSYSLEGEQYELLCEQAKALGLRVELRMLTGRLVELGLSNGYSTDLYGIDDLQRASRVLRSYLAREVSR